MGDRKQAATRRNWSIQDAKNRFGALITAAQRAPQTVTRHGKPAVVVVAAEEYERLSKPEPPRAAAALNKLRRKMPTGGDLIKRIDGRLRDAGF